MKTGRLEAFSDGVLAIIITIMVLEMKAPQEPGLAALRPLAPVFLSYVLSFVYLGIYWNNHHHLLQAAEHVDGRVLWANLHLLFWLSLIPFTTGWMGESHFAPWPTAVYGLVLLSAGLAYVILTKVLIARHDRQSVLVTAVGRDYKEKLSLLIYAVAVAAAFVHPWISCALYAVVAAIWFIPDRRIEEKVEERDS
jgi:uncharacterized membrane protein